MGRLEQLHDSIAVADTQAYALLDEYRERYPELAAKLKDLRQILAKALAVSKELTK